MATKKKTVKKVESKVVEKAEDVTALSFFECREFISEIEKQAGEEGELSDEQVEALVKAHTQQISKLKGMCNFIKLLEVKQQVCADRIKEIQEQKKKAKEIRDRLCSYLAPWVEEQGKSYHVGEYTLASRRSTSVSLPEGFDDAFYCTFETKVLCKPDKAAIKKAIEAGNEVPGCELEKKLNLTIK